MWTLLLDGLVVVLLVITIILAMILNRRFSSLRRDRLEFSTLAGEFHRAVASAEASVARLKTTSAELEGENRQAERHEDDLRQLIERADAAADRLEAAVRGARAIPDAPLLRRQSARADATAADAQATETPAKAGRASLAAARSAAERDLLQAMRFQR
ncbi:MAG: hypothetical protein JNM75_14040 [Rhodospirillales bacterium]|nr:hypothetical protein [Rhodospirillales bacterium]